MISGSADLDLGAATFLGSARVGAIVRLRERVGGVSLVHISAVSPRAARAPEPCGLVALVEHAHELGPTGAPT